MTLWRNLTGTAAEIEHEGHRYRVELKLFSPAKNVSLLRDGAVVRQASAPARFTLHDGVTIVVDSTEHGFRVAELRGGDEVRPLEPAAGTWEAGRVAWGRQHPTADRLISVVTGIVIVISLIYAALQLLHVITSIDVVQDLLGGWSFTMPFTPSAAVQIVCGLVVGASGADTALRMSPKLRARRGAPDHRSTPGS
ncbi:hypothetical protein [Microlunatus sp. Y2014]|uniref:hypothetical protein n=1 Tax=Microlunatus sp. Y2014 TaxID=3418488 RepID=UPI003DA6E921